MKGKLYVVSTPIGNLEDITLRALRILKDVDLIACEDTRTTIKMLTHYNIKKPLTSYHEHNETRKAKELLNRLDSGENIALVSDAGTPAVSDPGYRLLKLASEKKIEIICIPGPSAVIAALSVSGLPTSSFSFIGFLPRVKNKRIKYLEKIRNYPETLIIYESPNRVIDTLTAILEILGNRNASVSRELTKIFEETSRGKIATITEKLKQRKKLKGEFTIVIEGEREIQEEISSEKLEKQLRSYKDTGSSLKDTVEDLAKRYKIPKNKIYKKALKIWEQGH